MWRLRFGPLLLQDVATIVWVAAVVVSGVAPWQSFGALACFLCIHAFRGSMLTGQLVGFDCDMLPLLLAALSLMLLGLTLILVFIFPALSTIPTTELLVPLAIASVVWTLGCMAPLVYEATRAVGAEAVAISARSEANRSHLQRLQRLTMNIVGAEGMDGIESQTCIICLGGFQQGDMLLQLRCMHLHHAQCIQSWFLRGGSCPMRCLDGPEVVVDDLRLDIEAAAEDADIEISV